MRQWIREATAGRLVQADQPVVVSPQRIFWTSTRREQIARAAFREDAGKRGVSEPQQSGCGQERG